MNDISGQLFVYGTGQRHLPITSYCIDLDVQGSLIDLVDENVPVICCLSVMLMA